MASACCRVSRFALSCETRWHPPATPHARACAGGVRVHITLRNARMVQRIQALHQQKKKSKKKSANTRVQSCRQPLRDRSDGRAYVHALDQYAGLLKRAYRVETGACLVASPATCATNYDTMQRTCGITLGATHTTRVPAYFRHDTHTHNTHTQHTHTHTRTKHTKP